MTRVLFVDDEQPMCESVAAGLAPRGYAVEWRTSAIEALEAMTLMDFDVVVTDLNMREVTGLDLCLRVVANRPDIPVIVITAFGTLETAVATIRAGAFDFVMKPFDLDELAVRIDRAAQHRALRDEVRRLQQLVATRKDSTFVGTSEAMRRVLDMIARLGSSESTVLITGESGTGKELVAAALHRQSTRSSGPFIAINCAAMPESLLESELFGHVRGAFTDARTARKGLFVEATGGTLFLDEIGEMPTAIQPKLLRALQDRKVRPIGGNTEVPFDVRILTATNVDLETAVAERRFREDLFYRVNVVQIELPPLRARGNDVLLLAQHFLTDFAQKAGKAIQGFSGAVAERLLAYAWPGNVRELQNCIERAVAVAQFNQLTVEDLPDRIRSYRAADLLIAADAPDELPTLAEVERRYVLWVMQTVGGSKTNAARVLGLDRTTLWRKLERYGSAPKSNPEE
jgi:two-component system response regulator HydG